MHNTIIYLVWILIDLSLLLAAFTLWGRTGIIAVISATIILMNIFVLKGIRLLGLDATGGNVLYASIFLGTDIITEYYGAREARKAVFIGFFLSLLFLIASRFIILFTPAPWDRFHETMDTLFSPVWRIVIASITAYILSQNLDVITFTWLKGKFPNLLWLRNNASTWSSQIVDTALFCTIAFAGLYQMRIVAGIMLSTYLLKIVVAALDTPFIYVTKILVRLRPSILEE
ncbi:MAG: queuosine precursor transporter [Spirochaetes bacterium]|nr:queuosine precursor transporter [Spirochaetota bacterium]